MHQPVPAASGLLDVVSVAGTEQTELDQDEHDTDDSSRTPVQLPSAHESHPQKRAALVQQMQAITRRQVALDAAFQERRQLMAGMQAHMHRMADCLEVLKAGALLPGKGSCPFSYMMHHLFCVPSRI